MAKSIVQKCPHCGKSFADTSHKTLEQSANVEPMRLERSFWASDGVTYAISGVLVMVAVWLVAVIDGWWVGFAPIAGGGVALGLHLLKIILYAPIRPPKPPKPDKMTVSVRHQVDEQDSTRLLLRDFHDSIEAHELLNVCLALHNGVAFSRGELCKYAGISQSKYHRIKDEFLLLGYLHPLLNNANGYRLGLSGKVFVRKVASVARSSEGSPLPG